jgi:hypothetical protein
MTLQRKIRQSQTIVPFGVGAIFDIKGESLVGCDIRHWGPHGRIVHSERLARALGVAQLKSAPVVDTGAWAPPSIGIPYARFPSWLFCQKCRRMVRWNRSREQSGRTPECAHCAGRRQLVPMRWIQICANGHMDDFDWKRWAHSRSRNPEVQQCQKDDNLYFESVKGAGAGGLSTLQVRCDTCQARRNLADVTSKGSLKSINVTCTGRQPWQNWADRVDCDEVLLAVQRGASNVYFPLVHSSIEIPNPSRADAHSETAVAIKADPWFLPLLTMNDGHPMFDGAVDQLAGDHEVSTDFVRALVRDEKERQSGKGTVVTATPGDLLSEEWAAFLTEQSSQDDPDFRTRHVELVSGTGDGVASLLDERFDKVVLADRIREVRALEGFHRVTPAGSDKLVSVRLNHKDSIHWLPAIDVRGEGIFLSLDEGRLRVWEERDEIRTRIALLDRRLTESFMELRLRERTGPVLTPRYVLLHTFAHMLIRRLAFESGYAATSLRERIYARSSLESTGASRQAGVLIYTAAGDSEGTLGGLVRQGEPPHLLSTILESLQDAMWCSSDPLCSENSAATFANLNNAACHACTLVAETSCESGNYLLDRLLVVGSDAVPGFFQDVLHAAVEAAGEGVRGLS